MALLQKSGECGEVEMREFLEMHPGVRELRIRNLISAVWTGGEWKTRLGELIDSGARLPDGYDRADLIASELGSVRDQIGDMCFRLGVPGATIGEMREALLKKGEVTAYQQSFFLEGDRESLSLLDASLGAMDAEGLRQHWRSGAPNIVSAASAAHKLRFTSAKLTADEVSFLKTVLESDTLSQPDLNWFINAASSDYSVFGMLIDSIRFAIRNPAEPLLEAARASSEFETLLYCLGKNTEHAFTSIVRNPGFTQARRSTSTCNANGDAYTSLKIGIIRREQERRIAIDAVFDGVSGQGGASIASNIAKDTLEISALAGWIRGPEDVRMAATLADLVIDLAKAGLEHSDMGTTMAAAYIEDAHFFGIHCGDSDWKVIRGGSVIASSSPHGIDNRIWSGLGIGPRDLHVNNLGGMKYAPVPLKDGDIIIVQTDGIGDIVCDHELCIFASNNPPDAARTREAIVSLAGQRYNGWSSYETLCGCEPLSGKSDDQAIIVRLIKTGTN